MSSNDQYYQGHSKSSQIRHGSRNAANTCQYFTSLLKPEFDLLDVGCGPGSISATLAPFVHKGHVTGIDTSEDTLKNARNRADLPENCTFQLGNAANLDFPDNSFDVVHTSQVLIHLPDPIAAVKEFRRVLKPGGFIACREGIQSTSTWYPDHPGLTEWRRVSVNLHRDSAAADADAGRKLLVWATQAGFDIGKCTWTSSNLMYAGHKDKSFAHTLAIQTEDDGTYRRNVMEKGIGDEDSLALIREGWYAWAADPCSVFSLICGEIVAYK